MASPSFTAIVDLCRSADRARVSGTDLVVELHKSPEVVALLRQIEAGSWVHTIKVGGEEVTSDPDAIADGENVVASIHGMVRDNQVVANNVGSLLRLGHGGFLASKPSEFYLIQEDHASWETPTNPQVLAYERALKVGSLIKRLADAMGDRRDTGGEVVIFAGRKLVLPIVYDSASLDRACSDRQIDALERAIFDEQHQSARRDIVKRVLIRFLDSVPELGRFSHLLSVLDGVLQAFLADFDLYVSGFSFDKVREEFERKKLDFVVKINTASADALNKIIAIPVAQGLLVSQMKHDPGFHWINLTLLVASLVFAAIACMLIANQVNTLRNIRAELVAEELVLREKAAPTHKRLEGMISSLKTRLSIHSRAVPIVLGLLLCLTTLITCLAYANIDEGRHSQPSNKSLQKGVK